MDQASNTALLHRFYQAFQAKEGETMAACYGPNARFDDPAFHNLQGKEVGDMWRMLTARAQDFSLSYEIIEVDAQQGRARWTANYRYSATGRMVCNQIESQFRFANGLIEQQRDQFNLYRWLQQALGLKGWLLGWLPPVQAKVAQQARAGLAAWQRKQAA